MTRKTTLAVMMIALAGALVTSDAADASNVLMVNISGQYNGDAANIHTTLIDAQPDAGCAARTPWPPKEAVSGEGFPAPPGTTDTIAQGSAQRYGRFLRPGDRVFQTSEVVNCSPLKKTKLGPGYFQTNLQTFYNQKDEIVGTNLFTLLRYGGTPEESS